MVDTAITALSRNLHAGGFERRLLTQQSGSPDSEIGNLDKIYIQLGSEDERRLAGRLMRAMTVRGPISDDLLGITLMHEHLASDATCWYEESSIEGIADAPVETVDRDLLRRSPHAVKDNLILDDPELAARELQTFQKLGGSTVVDVTEPGIGRNPNSLQKISMQSGVNVICATGWYLKSSHPSLVKRQTLEDLTEIMRKELIEGIEGTSIRAGILGEIGISRRILGGQVDEASPMIEDEVKVLRAAGRAQRITGAPITIHVSIYKQKKDVFGVLDILEEEGVDLGKAVICHQDLVLDKGHHKAVMDRGAHVEFDNIGMEPPDYAEWFTITRGDRLQVATDSDRVRAIQELVQNGYASKLVLSHDTGYKSQLQEYGGHGYGHILRNIVPAMRKAGIAEKDIDMMLVQNPRRLLAYL